MSTLSKVLLPITVGSLLFGGSAASLGTNSALTSNGSCPIISQLVGGSCEDVDSLLAKLLGSGHTGNGSANNGSAGNSCTGNGCTGGSASTGGSMGSGSTGGSAGASASTGGSAGSGSITAGGSTSSTTSSYIAQVVELVNAERAKYGLSALTLNSTLSDAAQVRAKESATSFSHTRPNGTYFSTIFKEFGISYRTGGENLAWGQKTPKEVVTAWMNSSGHRANILNSSYTKIGIGIYTNASGTIYWSQLFTN